MSTPASLLSKYRSYNYRHVLVMCDSTETATMLLTNTDEGTWSHPMTSSGELGAYTPIDLGTDHKYCVLIDGATDATFVINQAKWSAATAAAATNADKMTSTAVEGSMDIIEPKGVVFMDTLVQCCGALGIDMQSACFLLKTFFTGFGYDEDTGDFVDTISDIAPIMFLVYDVTGSFTEQGGVYHMDFVALTGGATRLPQFSRIPGTVNIKAASTLGGTLKAVQTEINRLYDPYFSCVKAQMSASISATGNDPAPVVDSLRRVNYTIRYDPDYENYDCSNQVQSVKSDPSCSSPVTLSNLANASIEDILHRVMSCSKQVLEDASKGVGGGDQAVKYEYKIHPSVYTPKDKSQPVEVIYQIERFMRPKEIMKAKQFQYLSQYDKGTSSDPVLNETLRKQIIQFEYIYTGKNIDILEFEMKLNMGMAYLQIASMSNSYREQLDGLPNTTKVVGNDGQHIMNRVGKPVPIPVYFGSQVRSKNFKNSLSLIDGGQTAYTLAKHSSLEMAEATMRIVGNTNLLSGIGDYTSPMFHKDRSKDGTVSVLKQAPPDRDMGGFGVIPSFAHVTVKVPRNNDDISLFSGTGDGASADYTKDFWFDGYYYIYGIDNVFESGEFTQTLYMIGMPQEGIIDTKSDTANQRELNFDKKVVECFSGEPGCGPKADTNTTVPANKVENGVDTKQPPAVTTKQDANVVTSNTKQPEDVKGWGNAKPVIKDSITNAAAKTGTSSTTLAQMAAIESGFGRATVNPTSTARGTFQIVRGTWDQVVNSGQVPGVPPGTSFSEANDPEKNALVAATLMKQNQRSIARAAGVSDPSKVSAGDTYLAHFMGVGGASAVISADESGKGSITVKQAYINKWGDVKGAKIFESQRKANSSILNENTTCADIRATAATSMASSKPLASAATKGTPKPTSQATNAPTQQTTEVKSTNTPRSNVAVTRDCGAEEQKKQTQQSCDQAKPTTDKKDETKK